MGYGFFKGFDGLGTGLGAGFFKVVAGLGKMDTGLGKIGTAGLGKIGTGFLMDADEVNLLGFFLGGGGGVVDGSSFGGSGLGAGDLT